MSPTTTRASTPLIRERLLTAGLDLFHGQGYAATGVKEITDAAGVPKGSFYNHFGSKQELAVAALERYGTQAPLAELVDRSQSPVDAIRNHFEELGRRFTDSGYRRGCMLGNFSNEIADSEEPVRDLLAGLFDVWVSLIAAAVIDAQDQGLVASPVGAEVLAGVILSTWEGSLIRARTTSNDAPLHEFFDVVFNHLLAPPAA